MMCLYINTIVAHQAQLMNPISRTLIMFS